VRSIDNILTELQAALRAAGHGADEVQNAPVDMLNVFSNDEGRNPTATVIYDPKAFNGEGGLVWGHSWERSHHPHRWMRSSRPS
jgi:hypothetical protein